MPGISNGVYYEDFSDENHFFCCQCGCASHNFILRIWDWRDPDKKPKSLANFKTISLEVPERHYRGFFGKLKSVVGYIFGKDVEYDEVMVRTADITRLINLLTKYSNEIAEFAENNNIQIPFEPIIFGDNQIVLKSGGGKDVVFEKDNIYGDDYPSVLVVTVRLPKVSFWEKWAYIRDYLKYDGHYGDADLGLDAIRGLTSFLATFPVLQVKKLD